MEKVGEAFISLRWVLDCCFGPAPAQAEVQSCEVLRTMPGPFLWSCCTPQCRGKTQEDGKETRMGGRKRVGGRERISQGDNKMGGIAAETMVRREIGEKNLKDVKEVEKT
ncbi:hypothetical protein EK904_002690 [Melospiza melodia maxima]|nr:hypothetical protein EK904_002690 [Melospiza melodia maxima]